MDPIMGEHVQVTDTNDNRCVTIRCGVGAWERAEERCRELNEEEKNGSDLPTLA